MFLLVLSLEFTVVGLELRLVGLFRLTIQCNTRSYLNVSSKRTEPKTKKAEKRKAKTLKTDKLRRIGKQSGESVESVLYFRL